ncbi:Protein pollen defective in guidance 1 [Vitis vinifera]|uniref:Protein pollen defective in guidance 1 n=1 Tax=Vitis vinifera TaxID=29760 RepID=A0A438HXW2_VITVI|nr:Protein pollen defective in guidance 1 [Vitis vinifera]
MDLRRGGRKLSFEILSASNSIEDEETLSYRSNSDPIHEDAGVSPSESRTNRRKRKNKGSKKKKKTITCPIDEDPHAECCYGVGGECPYGAPSPESEFQNLRGDGYLVAELRQRSVNGSVEVRRWRIAESLDWKRFMVEDPTCSNLSIGSVGNDEYAPSNPVYSSSLEKSPLKYFMEEMYSGNSLQSTTTLGNEKERERVYDTIFRLPWRCELLIDVGFFVCLDSFLSLLTIMPTRILMALWRLLNARLVIFLQLDARQNVKSLIGLMGGWVNMILSPCSFQRKFKMQVVYVVDEAVSCKMLDVDASVIPEQQFLDCLQCNRAVQEAFAAELSDFGCFVVMACGVALLYKQV